MINVIITGATGMTGGLVLSSCLADSKIAKVISLVRKKTEVQHEKLEEVVVDDFNDLSGNSSYFENIDIAYFCIGVYTGAVDNETFEKITVDYTKEFAKTLKEKSPDATLCFLSGMGADREEKSRMIFARTKGMAENYLESLDFKNLYIFRPAYIYPVEKRVEPNLSYKIMRFLYPLMNLIYPNSSVRSTDLGSVMFRTGLNGGEKTILENRDIRGRP